MEAEPDLTDGACLYLYGVVQVATGLRPVAELAGIEGAPVSLVCFEGLAAAVTPVPADAYSDAALRTHAEELEWIAARALRHEDIVRRLGRSGPVVPLKFGTLCATAAGVREILRDHYEPFRALLDRFANREEWGLKADLSEALAIGVLERSETTALDSEIGAASPGHAYLLRKKKRNLLAASLERLAADLAADIFESVRSRVADARRLAPAEPLPDRTRVMAAAVLVDAGGLDGLRAAAEAIEERYREYGLRLELSGPWAPFSFCGQLGS